MSRTNIFHYLRHSADTGYQLKTRVRVTDNTIRATYIRPEKKWTPITLLPVFDQLPPQLVFNLIIGEHTLAQLKNHVPLRQHLLRNL